MSLARMVRERRVLICLGAGGVGKTTVAAALGLAGALAGRRALVLTVDPARRLADALGVRLGPEPEPVPAALLGGALPPGAGLDAMMLEQRTAWARLLERTARSPADAARLGENRLYRALSESLAGTHELLAIETLCSLVEAGRHDLIVVNTPPSVHALTWLEAPARIRGLLDRHLLRWLLKPASAARRGRGGFLMRRLEAATGSSALREAGDFFAALSGLFAAFAARARDFEVVLADPGTAFVLVASPDGRALADTRTVLSRLRALSAAPAAIVANRVHPVLAGRFDAAAVTAALAAAGAPEPDWLARTLLSHQALAAAQARRLGELRAAVAGTAVTELPDLPDDGCELSVLAALVSGDDGPAQP